MKQEDLNGLAGAYSNIYEASEILNEENNSKDLEDIAEQGGSRSSRGPMDPAVSARWRGIGNTLAYGNAQGRRPSTLSQPTNLRGGGSRPISRPKIGSLPPSARQVTQYPQGVSTGVGGGNAGSSTGSGTRVGGGSGAPKASSGSATRVGGGSLSSGGGATRPAAPATKVGGGSMSSGGGKVVPTASMKQTGDKAKDTQTWAKANPTLANKPQRTFNPLMQRTFGYQTGYSPSEVKGNIQKAKTMATVSNSFEWNSKTMKDLSELYSSVYEAKKVDQDKDGDNDFADVRIARMIASGVPKEVAIAKVKNKPYNEEFDSEEISSENKITANEETMYFTEEEAYEIVASYLLEYNFAETIGDADNIIENMSASWVGEILDKYVGMIEEERAPGVKPYKPGKTGAEVRAQMRDAEKKRARSGADKKGYGPDEKFYKPEDKRIPDKDTAEWFRRTKKKFGRPFGKYDPKKIITQDIINKMPKDK